MLHIAIKPADKLIKGYYDVLGGLGQLHFDHEGAVRSAFQEVLAGYSRKLHWTLVTEYRMKGRQGQIAIDAALIDSIQQKMGFWEAKDERDDLEREVRRKIERGYPTSNIIFQAPTRAILYQKGIRQGLNEDISDGKNLAELLHTFFEYLPPDYEEWKQSIEEFKARLPEISEGVQSLIEKERRGNRDFVTAFEAFYALCRQAINPNLTAEAVERMLVQHILTERIFRRIFNNPDFTRRNVIAAEVEKVISSLTHRAFDRDAFLAQLDHYYRAIEKAAENTETYTERQGLLNTVYERFFQGYSPKEADTHGIVYTPQPIVDFMVRSVEDILEKEFGRSLADHNVHILDPFVGTGNFITRVMRQIAETDKGALPYKYEHELHCNEVMLLPYYIASMNIEHAYLDVTGEYKPFNGICLVDTFELEEHKQSSLSFMTEENAQRVRLQKQSDIFVIIGNPPYNMGQIDESDQNKNRKYLTLDEKVRSTYIAESNATLLNKLSDPYVLAFKWATDRLGEEGIVAFITNNSFIDQVAFDGMREHLRNDFDCIYLLDLGGNVRKNPRLSGTTHNVFGIQVGVSINLLVRYGSKFPQRRNGIWYARIDEYWRKEQKYRYLEGAGSRANVEWTELQPDTRNNWITEGLHSHFAAFVPIADPQLKSLKKRNVTALFKLFSLGLVTNRDPYTYNFSREGVENVAKKFLNVYNNAVALAKSRKEDKPRDLVNFEDPNIKWTRQVIASLYKRRDSVVQSGDYLTCSPRISPCEM